MGYTNGVGYAFREHEPVKFWYTFDGVKKRVSEIDHQHLSNIIYFMAYVNSGYRQSIKDGFHTELKRRFNGILLSWKPLRRFEGEMEFLKENNYLKEHKDSTFIVINNKIIGQVAEE